MLNIVLAVASAYIFYNIFDFMLNIILRDKITLMQRLEETEHINELKDYKIDSSENILEKILSPLLSRIIDLLILVMPSRFSNMRGLSEQLEQAGLSMTPEYYSALVIVRTAVTSLLFIFICFLLGGSFATYVFFGIIGVLFGLVMNRFYLKKKITLRKEAIYHELPSVMDLLSVSVAAGLGFDQALAYVVEKGEGALINELDITRRELSLGASKKTALTALADRCDNIELRTFATAVLQAEDMGASIQNVLKIQADTIRETHKQKVEESAQKLPIKMIFPLVLFLLPTIFIVLLGSAALSLMQVYNAGGGF